MTTEFTNVSFVPSSSSSSSRPSSYPSTITPTSKPPRQKKKIDYKDRKAVKARHLSRIFPTDWLERFADQGVSWDSPDAYAMYLRVHQRLVEMEAAMGKGKGKQKDGEGLGREEAMRMTLRWVLKEGGEFVRQQELKLVNHNDVNGRTDGQTHNEREVGNGGMVSTGTHPFVSEDQLTSRSTTIASPVVEPLRQPPRGTLAYLVSRSYDLTSYEPPLHTTNINQDRKRRRGSFDSSSSGDSRSGLSGKRRRGDSSEDEVEVGLPQFRDRDLGKTRTDYWELDGRGVWVDRNLGYGVLFQGNRKGGRGRGSISGGSESDGRETEEDWEEPGVDVPEVRFCRSGRVVAVDKRSSRFEPSSDPSRLSKPTNVSEEDDDASSDRSTSTDVELSNEQPSFESTWPLRIYCPAEDDDELDEESEPAEYILHVSHLAPCLPNKQTATRLLSETLSGVPSHPALHETAGSSSTLHTQDDLLGDMVAGSGDIITITQSSNDRKDAFPLDVMPRHGATACDCSCLVEQLGFDGAWFEVPVSGLAPSRDFQAVLNEVLHGPSRLLGRRLKVILRDVHFWIDRGLPFMARCIDDHSKRIQALGCQAIPAPMPDTSRTLKTDSTWTTFWPAGGFDDRPAALVPRVLTIGHGFVLWAIPVSGDPAQRWTVDVVGPGRTLVIPFERRIVMFHLTDSAIIETEVCHHQFANSLRRILSRREDESPPNTSISDEATSQLFLAIEKMTESLQREDRIADYTFTRNSLLEVCEAARKMASRSQKRRFIAQKERLTAVLEQKRPKGVT